MDCWEAAGGGGSLEASTQGPSAGLLSARWQSRRPVCRQAEPLTLKSPEKALNGTEDAERRAARGREVARLATRDNE